MATAAKEVPWPDVVDFIDELYDWLVKAGFADKEQSAQRGVWRILSQPGDDESPPRMIARSIVDLVMFHGAGRRADLLAGEGGAAKVDEATRQAAFDDSVEREAEADIRALFPRFARVEKLVDQIAERNNRALAQVASRMMDSDSRRQRNEVLHHVVLARLNAVRDATNALLEDFLEFSPADTEEPLTLRGWQKLERSVRTDLKAAGYKSPK